MNRERVFEDTMQSYNFRDTGQVLYVKGPDGKLRPLPAFGKKTNKQGKEVYDIGGKLRTITARGTLAEGDAKVGGTAGHCVCISAAKKISAKAKAKWSGRSDEERKAWGRKMAAAKAAKKAARGG